MSVASILDESGKIKALYGVPEGLAAKIEALEEFARLIAEVVAIQLEDGSTYHYTGVPQGIQPVPVQMVAVDAKEPEDPGAVDLAK